jgi:uncharacterized membrane-anchored protein YitT (DUF2179 family)
VLPPLLEPPGEHSCIKEVACGSFPKAAVISTSRWGTQAQWTRGIRVGRFKSPVVAAIASAVLTATVVGGVAIAQTSTDSAEIIACVAENSGNVRIIQPTNDCKPNEVKTTWQQQGPVGPPGP